jgi:multiple sugar transport system substrate-binding protein
LPLASGCKATTTPAEPVTIRFAYGLGDPGYYQPLLEEFNQTYPNITVELAESDAGEADVYFVTPFELGDLVEQGDILNLDPLSQQDESFDRADFYPGTLEICSREGRLWAVPGGLTMVVLYYNQDLFDQYGVSYPESGWTWDDLLEKALALRDPTAGVFGYAPTNEFLDPLPFIYQHGGGLTDDLQNPTRATFDDPLTIEALEWYAALIHAHNVMPTESQMLDWGGSVEAGVYSNKVGMWSDWLANQGGAGGLESPWPGEWRMRWGMVPLPHDAQAATMVIVFGYVISSQAANPEASWQWIAFLSHQVYSPYRTTPARKSLAESAAYAQLESQDVATIARESMESAILLSPTITQFLGPYGEAIQTIRSGDATPQEALTRAQQEAEQ